MEQKKSNKKLMIIIAIAVVVIIAIVGVVVFTSGNKENNNNNELQQEQKVLSKEEMIQQAEYISWEDMFNDISENEARAKEKYSKNYWIGNVFISNISTYSCDVYVKDNLGQYLKQRLTVDLPTEELATINKGDTVKIVFKCSVTPINPIISGNIVEVVKSDKD